MICESDMTVKRLISVFAAFCLLAGCELGLSAESIQIAFPVGNWSIDSTYLYNARACTRIYDAVSSFSNSSRITVRSFSSPDGKLSRNRQLARLRAASVHDFLCKISPSLASSIDIVTVDEDWEGVKSYLKRTNKEWKKEALQIIDNSSGDKKALLQDLWVGEAWEDLMKNCFPSLRRVSVEIQDSDIQPFTASGCFSMVIFSQGSSRVPGSYFSNLRKLVQSAPDTLYISLKASPEGTLYGNSLLSDKRARNLESVLRKFGYTGYVNIKYDGEDWEGLLNAVKCSTDMSDKESVIEILSDSTLDRDSRKKSLQALSYGKTWLRLMDTEMSGLRKAIISPYLIL